ncbi:hypothetical protein M8C21_029665, partial [Ambrosia artemisiifolia]
MAAYADGGHRPKAEYMEGIDGGFGCERINIVGGFDCADTELPVGRLVKHAVEDEKRLLPYLRVKKIKVERVECDDVKEESMDKKQGIEAINNLNVHKCTIWIPKVGSCDDLELALSYGAILRDRICHQETFQLLGTMLFDRSNTLVMVRYVRSLNNLRICMNLLRDSNKSIQLEAFHVF